MSLKSISYLIFVNNLILFALGTACGPKIQGTLRKMCSQKYPVYLIDKYLDEIVIKNDMYAFYEEINKEFILLTQKRQELTECDLLEIISPRTFKCLIGNSVENISYDRDVFNTTIQCFTINEEFRLLFVEELADYCGYVPDQRISEYIIHYVSLPEEIGKPQRVFTFSKSVKNYLSVLYIFSFFVLPLNTKCVLGLI